MKNSITKLVLAAVCLALGLVIPSVFHSFGAVAGQVFLPMHIPVLLCGFICGRAYGAACGAAVPLLSSVMTGMAMPPIYPTAVIMMFELCAYGLFCGVLYKRFNVYVSLVGAMLCGRIVNGAASAVLLGIAGKPYGMSVFITASFVKSLPGIIIQILLIPVLVILLTRLKIVEGPKQVPLNGIKQA